MIEETFNWDLLKMIAQDRKSFEAVRCDGDPDPEFWEPSPLARYFLIVHEGKVRGFWMFVPRSPHLGELHFTLLSSYWGDIKGNRELGEEALKEIFTVTGVKKLIGMIPSFNKNAVSFTQRIGMKREGIIKNACYRDDKPFDYVVMGVE